MSRTDAARGLVSHIFICAKFGLDWAIWRTVHAMVEKKARAA